MTQQLALRFDFDIVTVALDSSTLYYSCSANVTEEIDRAAPVLKQLQVCAKGAGL